MSTLSPASATARSFSANRLFRVLRSGLQMAQAVIPYWAPRVAARVFCTPVPTKLATRHARPPPGVRIESLPFERASITLYHWPARSDAPQLLMTHGWGGWGMQMASLADALSAAGWAVVVIDQPAHGRSAAWSSTLPQFVRALGYAAARLGRVQALVGHSMGGAAACVAAANGLALRKLALLSAPVSMLEVTHDYATAFGLRESLRARMVALLEGREGAVFERMAAQHTAPRVTAPTLVVHDHDDSTVPYAAAQVLMAALPDAQLFSTRGLGHRRVLKDRAVIEALVRFVGQP
ncbi:MAG: alpha/beta hydrolase [Pseudomonadota bacterium]